MEEAFNNMLKQAVRDFLTKMKPDQIIYSHGKTFYLCDYIRKDNIYTQNSKPSTIIINDVLKLNEKIIYNNIICSFTLFFKRRI